MLIEQLLHGLIDREMCDEIIAKKPSSFQEAYEVAHLLKSTRQTAEEMKAPTSHVEKSNALHSSTQQYKQNTNNKAKTGKFRKGTKPTGTTKNTQGQDTTLTCFGCGAQHLRSQCPFRNTECHACKKKGHLAKVYRSKSVQNSTKQIMNTESSSLQVDRIARLNSIFIHYVKKGDRQIL